MYKYPGKGRVDTTKHYLGDGKFYQCSCRVVLSSKSKKSLQNHRDVGHKLVVV